MRAIRAPRPHPTHPLPGAVGAGASVIFSIPTPAPPHE